MAYADSIRTSGATMEAVASLIEGIGSAGYPLTWTTWTPTYTGGTGTWPGAGTAKYLRIGKLVIFTINATATLSGTATAYVTYTIPITEAPGTPVFASGWILPDGSNVKSATTFMHSTPAMRIQRYDGANLTNGTVGFALVGIYEAA